MSLHDNMWSTYNKACVTCLLYDTCENEVQPFIVTLLLQCHVTKSFLMGAAIFDFRQVVHVFGYTGQSMIVTFKHKMRYYLNNIYNYNISNNKIHMQ